MTLLRSHRPSPRHWHFDRPNSSRNFSISDEPVSLTQSSLSIQSVDPSIYANLHLSLPVDSFRSKLNFICSSSSSPPLPLPTPIYVLTPFWYIAMYLARPVWPTLLKLAIHPNFAFSFSPSHIVYVEHICIISMICLLCIAGKAVSPAPPHLPILLSTLILHLLFFTLLYIILMFIPHSSQCYLTNLWVEWNCCTVVHMFKFSEKYYYVLLYYMMRNSIFNKDLSNYKYLIYRSFCPF